MRKLVFHFLLAFSVWTASSQVGSATAQSRRGRVGKIPTVSLCELTKDLKRYVGQIVRVRITILGTGGHSTFFIAAEDCLPGTVTILWARFDSRWRIDGQVESKFLRAVAFNSDREKPKAESFLIGRVSNFSNGLAYKMMMSIRDVEPIDGVRSSRRVAEQSLAADGAMHGFQVTFLKLEC